jgi:hypothetical protein
VYPPYQAYTEIRMAHSTFRPGPQADVLRKVFDLPGRGITRPLAESLLALDLLAYWQSKALEVLQ